MTGESRETPCYKDLSSGDEPSISSSTTTFLHRVSTVVLPPSPSDCSVSKLNLQPAATRRRRGSTHQHMIIRMTSDEEEGEGVGQNEYEDEGQDEGEYCEREASTSRPPVNTELLLYVKKNSVVTMETDEAKGRPEITLGGDDAQVSGDSGKSCCGVATEFTPSLDLPTYTNDVSNFKSKQDTRFKVQQPPEDSSSSFSPTTISSGLQRPRVQNQRVSLSSSSIRKTSNENSETNEAGDQVKLLGVFSESSSSLHPEEEGLVLSFVSTTGEDVSYFRSKEDTSNSVSPATILYGLHQTQEGNQQVHFSSSTLRRTFSENLETKDAEVQVKSQGVSSEPSFALQQEGGLTLSLDLPTVHRDVSLFRSKEDCPANALSDLNQTQDQKQRASVSLSTIRKNSEFRDTENQVNLPGVFSESSSNLLPKDEGLMLKFDPLKDSEDVSNFRSKEDTSSSISAIIISPYLHTAPDYNQQADISCRIIRKAFTDNSVTSVLLPEEEGLALRLEPTTGDEDISNVRSRGHNWLCLISSVLSGLHQTQDQNQQADILPSSINKTFTDNSETKEFEDQMRLPGVSSEYSSALHQEHGELALRFDKSQDSKGISHFRSKEDTSSPLIPATVSLDLHRPQDPKQQVDLSSRTIRKTFAENSETKETPEEVKCPGVNVPSPSSLFPEEKGFVLRFDLSSSAIRKAFNKNSETKDTEDHMKSPGVSLESLCVLLPEEEAKVHGDLSILQPSGSSTIIQEDQGNKNSFIFQQGMFIQKTEPDSSGPKPVHHPHHCVSVHTKTCDLRGHIYQPITSYLLLYTQRVDERSASMSLRPGLRRSSRVVECLTEGCCICSAGLKSRQETESHQRPDPQSPDRWLFDEVEDELEDIWRQTVP